MATSSAPNILSVSEVTAKIKALLEKSLPFVWINGEISNLRNSAAGHFYFSLKDAKAQISAVMFKTQRRGLMFELENGMNINCLGRLSVYEERGNYQIIVEFAEHAGAGGLHAEFEALKAKLEAEGLFAMEHKRPMPPFPRKIALITSPAGSVIHDMLTVAQSKLPVDFYLMPIRVQGGEAAAEIVDALASLGDMPDVDIAVLARGGGAAEDLQPFNDETVARALFNCPVPVVSAIGHETDFSISDFMADLRAPTPSAAIDILLPDKDMLLEHIQSLQRRLSLNMSNALLAGRERLHRLERGLVSPARRLSEQKQVISYLEYKLKQGIIKQVQTGERRLGVMQLRLEQQKPQRQLFARQLALNEAGTKLKALFENKFITYLNKTKYLNEKLLLLGPAATLERGYSIVVNPLSGGIINDVNAVKPGQELTIIMKNGEISCSVTNVKVAKHG